MWLEMRRDLDSGGKATIQTAICTRDDIMIYLISHGTGGRSFLYDHGERSKGKRLKPEWEEGDDQPRYAGLVHLVL